MDIITHAVVGAASGAVFGHPVVGAIYGVLPDLFASIKRKLEPGPAYRLAHSFTGLSIMLLFWLPTGELNLLGAAFLAYLSHIVLDLTTHGPAFAPRLFWPCGFVLYSGKEWEWFNSSWCFGLLLAFYWSVTCLYFAS